MSGRSPVITGVGVLAAPGSGVDVIWNSIEENRSGLTPLSLFNSPRYGQLPVGEIRYDLDSLGAPKRGSRSDKLAWIAAMEAVASSGIDLSKCPDRTGFVLGSSVGGSFGSERFLTNLIKRGRMLARPTRFHECCSAVNLIADALGILGPCTTIATACSSGALAIATAADLIMSGDADVMIAGGADSLSRMTWGGFQSLLLVDPEGCRPFDTNRSGMSLGEGGGMLLIESEESAVARGVTILARLSGWGASCDAHHITAPHPRGEGAAQAMRSALKRAGLSPTDIDYVNAHGTGTRDNDLAEAHALRTVFDGNVPPFSSTKRFFGHPLAASGAIEAIVCIEALRRGKLPTNPGFSETDPEIELSPVTEQSDEQLTHAMSNSFGFGGNNAVLIFSHPDSAARPIAPEMTTIGVTGIGLIAPNSDSEMETAWPLPPGTANSRSISEIPDEKQLTPIQRRRLSRLVKLAVVAARRCSAEVGDERTSVALGTGLGGLEDAGDFLENLISKDEAEPMPSKFPGSVHNAAAAQIALEFKARGLNSAPTMGEISFESALCQGIAQLRNDEADLALVGAVDALNKYPLAIGRRWKLWTDANKPGEGVMVTGLRRTNAADQPIARVTTSKLGRYRRPLDPTREAVWLGEQFDLTKIDAIMTGAGGWPFLDPLYESIVKNVATAAGHPVGHLTYKQETGEFHSASALGFAKAVEVVRDRGSRVILYTLSPTGSKAATLLEP